MLKELPSFYRNSDDYSVAMISSMDRAEGSIIPGAVPELRRLVACFPPLRPGFDARSGYVRFMEHIRRGADKSLAFTVSYFPVCSTTKKIFLGWVKEVRTPKL
jgi:hypothetical protein